MLLRYEDFLADPVAETQRLAQALQLSVHDAEDADDGSKLCSLFHRALDFYYVMSVLLTN